MFSAEIVEANNQNMCDILSGVQSNNRMIQADVHIRLKSFR